MEQQLYLPFPIPEGRCVVSHGAYLEISPFELEQIAYYGLNCECNPGGFAEVLYVKYPPRDLAYLVVCFLTTRGYYAIEIGDRAVAEMICESVLYTALGGTLDPSVSPSIASLLSSVHAVIPWTYDPWFYPENVRGDAAKLPRAPRHSIVAHP